MSRYHYPPGYSFFGTYQRALKVVKSPLETMMESVDRFGESYSVADGFSGRMILTQDPEFIDYVLRRNHRNYNKSRMVTQKLGRFIGNGLLTSNGAYWLRQRRLIQPGFHPQKIKDLYVIMQATIDRFLEQFPAGDHVDIYPLMNRLAFDVVVNTLFDIDLPADTIAELSRFISEIQEFVITDIRQPYNSWWFEVSGRVAAVQRKAERVREILRGVVRERKASGRRYNDLLDMLLDARYEDTGEGMTEEQILDEIVILFIAGHETTGNSLAWTLYLLATHRDELETLREETLDLSTSDTVAHPRLQAVINESMRLYPPAWVSDRVSIEDDSFNGFTYPAGTIIALFYYGLHRSAKYWEEPLSFRPERFLRQKENTRIFFPFGGGPRLCIGNNFAMAEMALFLRSFIRKFELQPTDTTPRIRPLVTLRPEGIYLGVHPHGRGKS
ncbi:MAG: cytochrome P450 [Cyclobacteriaceae bacterium]|nr:cytochrome P450 [Cyclobacteriaceae bacterium]